MITTAVYGFAGKYVWCKTIESSDTRILYCINGVYVLVDVGLKFDVSCMVDAIDFHNNPAWGVRARTNVTEDNALCVYTRLDGRLSYGIMPLDRYDLDTEALQSARKEFDEWRSNNVDRPIYETPDTDLSPNDWRIKYIGHSK